MINNLPHSWQDELSNKGFDQFTDIQNQLFKPIQENENVLGISPTGTGKTLAYLFPSLLNLKPKKAQQLLILAPNTELAGQIFDVTKEWAKLIGLEAQLLLSGSSQKRQIERLKKGPEIIIGTPGRIFELVKLKKVKMMSIETIILDEYDELLSDSQFHFVNSITHYVPKDHQMIYISATNKIKSSDLVNNTIKIDLSHQTLNNINHYYIQVDKRQGTELLRKFSNIPQLRGLVFFNNLSDLGSNEEKLTYQNANVVSLASDINTKFRKVILDNFKHQKINLLLATDMVARGIDIENLELVINYDIPRNKEVYTHRSGRTGRMGKEGTVITFVTHPEDLKNLKNGYSL